MLGVKCAITIKTSLLRPARNRPARTREPFSTVLFEPYSDFDRREGARQVRGNGAPRHLVGLGGVLVGCVNINANADSIITHMSQC
jgi:hypothetical protein